MTRLNYQFLKCVYETKLLVEIAVESITLNSRKTKEPSRADVFFAAQVLHSTILSSDAYDGNHLRAISGREHDGNTCLY